MAIENIETVEYHQHTGIDSPKIDAGNVTNAVAGDDAVLLTGAQTVAGVKTFTSIPVLPASDPTTDNQAVRKAYADSQLGGTEAIATDNLRDSANTDRFASTTSYTKVKEITFNEGDGNIRVKFDMRLTGGAGTAYGRIYVNGIAVGTEQSELGSTYVTYSEDISVETGDLVQLYYKDSGGNKASVRRFRLYYDKVFTVTPGTVNQN